MNTLNLMTLRLREQSLNAMSLFIFFNPIFGLLNTITLDL